MNQDNTKTIEVKMPREVRAISKEPILESVSQSDNSALKKYQNFFIGKSSLGALCKFETITTVFGPMPGALGLFLRKLCYPSLFKIVGRNLVFGRNIALRHPGKIEIGNGVGIDDGCLLDAKGPQDSGIRIGNDVLIARSTIIQVKGDSINIGDRCVIGSQSQLTSVGGITLGNAVMVSGQCYIGGGRYHTDSKEIPIMDQGLYSKGPIIIGDDVWLGAGVIVQDGVRIGKGCVVGSGAVVTEDIPDFAIAIPNRKLLLLPRGESML